MDIDEPEYHNPSEPTPPGAPITSANTQAFLGHAHQMRLYRRQINQNNEQKKSPEQPQTPSSYHPAQQQNTNGPRDFEHDGEVHQSQDINAELTEWSGLQNTNGSQNTNSRPAGPQAPTLTAQEIVRIMTPADYALYSRPDTPPPSPPMLHQSEMQRYTASGEGTTRGIWQLCVDENGKRMFVRRPMLLQRPVRVFPGDGSESPRMDFTVHDLL